MQSNNFGKIKKCVYKSFKPSLHTSIWLLKIMLPISLGVKLLMYMGIIEWMAQYINPFFQYIGLPGASAIAFLTSAFSTTYAGLAVMLSLTLTLRQATILAVMALICHALPMESAVVKKVGSKAWKMALIRVVAAFLAALYLNVVLPEFKGTFGGLNLSDDMLTFGSVMEMWAVSSLKLAVMIFCLIYGLTFIQKMLETYKLMERLVNPLKPLMKLFGLPDNSAYLWLVGNILGISYGSAAMVSLQESGQISREDANEVNYHLIMNHSMLEDTMVFATAGISAFWILSTRLLFAIVLVWGRKTIMHYTK